MTAVACSGRGTVSSGADSSGLKGARFTLILQSTANANKVVEVHAVKALAAQGVNASVKWNASSPNIAITQLTTGAIDAYSEAVLGGVAAVASGIKMKDFALAQPRQDYVMLANSGINSLADLKGKKIGVQDTTGVNYAQALLAVQKAGLTSKDVDIIAVGGQSARLPALVAGRVDATMLSHAAGQQLASKGFNDHLRLHQGCGKSQRRQRLRDGRLVEQELRPGGGVQQGAARLVQLVQRSGQQGRRSDRGTGHRPRSRQDTMASVFEDLRAANAYPNGAILDPANARPTATAVQGTRLAAGYRPVVSGSTTASPSRPKRRS